ncbi:uncharacterized protein [Panulirus ornatus]|uniref:uncharacterized protein n=1 Tax=Panulirus ornatus TaxID=150431 RepID=UPI003A89EFAE
MDGYMLSTQCLQNMDGYMLSTQCLQNKLTQEEVMRNQAEIAKIMAWIHESFCLDENLTTTDRVMDLHTSSYAEDMTSVNAMVDLVTAFSQLYQQKKKQVHTRIKELQDVLHHVRHLEDHIQGLHESHSWLETTLDQAAANVQNITENLKKREADVLLDERHISDLRKEVALLEKAREELSADVAEYVQETEAPLEQITDAVAHLDIHRIRKLLSRSPISAIQLVFECAVFLLGSGDMSWRAVRHATQDDNFCTKLAAVSVPELKLSVITMLTEKLEQVKMTSDHMSRVSDIGGVLLQYLRVAVYFWYRYHEDVQPRQARVHTLRDHKKQLQVEMATKERLMKVHKEQMDNMNFQLKEEEENIISLKKQKMAVEEELQSVLGVTTKLNPHSERWRKEMDDGAKILKQMIGQCLLTAAHMTYLTSLTPATRERILRTWRSDLVARGFLPPQEDLERQDQFRLVSEAGNLQQDVTEAMNYHLAHSTTLLVRDPHSRIEDYVSGGIAVNMDVASWLEEVKERLTQEEEEEQCVLLLHTKHDSALEVVNSLKILYKDFVNDVNNPKAVVVVEDDCVCTQCPLCSCHTVINIMLNQKGIVQQVMHSLARWHAPAVHAQMQQVMKELSSSRTEQHKTEASVMSAIRHTTNVACTTQIASLIQHLDNATVLTTEHDNHLKDLTTLLSGSYLHMARYAAQLLHLTNKLSTLNPCYALTLNLLQESLAHKLSSNTHQDQHSTNISCKDGDDSYANEEMLKLVTDAVCELLNTRLHMQHRLIVSTCIALTKLNLRYVDEDYVETFLRPLHSGQMIWQDISQLTSLKKQETSNTEDELEQDATNDKEDEENRQIQEEKLPHWIQCNTESRHVLIQLNAKCRSLFPVAHPTLQEDEPSHLLLWLTRGTERWPACFSNTDTFLQAAQRVLLARHLRKDLLLEAMTHLVNITLGKDALKCHSDMLSQTILLQSRKQITERSGTTNMIQVNVNQGGNILRVLTEAARRAGLPYYKLTFLSLPTASHQELRRRVVMSARRRTWLVLLHCELSQHKLSHIQTTIRSLPTTLARPTVFCVVGDVLGSDMNLQNALVAQVQRPIGLASSIAANLPIAFHHLQMHSSTCTLSAALTRAATVATAYIYSLLQARGEHGPDCWMNSPPLTETLLVDSLQTVIKHTYTPHKSWDTLANILAKVIYGSVVASQLDQRVINKIFSDHLNDQTFSNLTRNIRKEKHLATQDLSPEPSNQNEALTAVCRREDDHINILLHSLPTEDITLDLELPSHKATENLCKQVESREATLLGMCGGQHTKQETQQMILALEAFTETPWVRVPAWTVIKMAAELESALPGKVSVLAEQITREVDPENQAWQREAEIWDATQDNGRRKIQLILQAVNEETLQPAQALLTLAEFVHSVRLVPDGSSCWTTRSTIDNEHATQNNMISVRKASIIVKSVKTLVKEWKERHRHLLTWWEGFCGDDS